MNVAKRVCKAVGLVVLIAAGAGAEEQSVRQRIGDGSGERRPMVAGDRGVAGTLVWDQGTPDLSDGVNVGVYRCYEDFQLADARRLLRVRFWTLEENPSPFAGEAVVSFYADSGSGPGALLAWQTVGLSRTATGRGAFNLLEWENSASLNTTLPAGSYFISISMDPTCTQGSLYWESSGPGVTYVSTVAENCASPAQAVEASNVAFQLFGEASCPRAEPASNPLPTTGASAVPLTAQLAWNNPGGLGTLPDGGFESASFDRRHFGVERSSDVVFSTAPPNAIGGDDMSYFRQADDFILAKDTLLTRVRFWTTEFEPWDGTVEVMFHADNGGAIGGVSATPAVIAVDRAQFGAETYAFEYTVTISPTLLPAGRGWLSLHMSADCATLDNIYWTYSDAAPFGSLSSSALGCGAFYQLFSEHAFELIGSLARCQESYEVYYRPASSPFPFTILCETTDPVCLVENLACGQQYEWFVATRGGNGDYVAGPVWTFTTRPCCCEGDADGSGEVNFVDIVTVLRNWLKVCPQ
ncbi:MAG: hypothetical protein SFZ24_12315 [Planctomycetota bacterium]|nr:hypothetical protein [Planctomycetota bacterium]